MMLFLPFVVAWLLQFATTMSVPNASRKTERARKKSGQKMAALAKIQFPFSVLIVAFIALNLEHIFFGFAPFSFRHCSSSSCLVCYIFWLVPSYIFWLVLRIEREKRADLKTFMAVIILLSIVLVGRHVDVRYTKHKCHTASAHNFLLWFSS